MCHIWIDNPPKSCYNYKLYGDEEKTVQGTSTERESAAESSRPTRTTDSLEPPGESRARPRVTAGKRRHPWDDAKMGGTAKRCFFAPCRSLFCVGLLRIHRWLTQQLFTIHSSAQLNGFTIHYSLLVDR